VTSLGSMGGAGRRSLRRDVGRTREYQYDVLLDAMLSRRLTSTHLILYIVSSIRSIRIEELAPFHHCCGKLPTVQKLAKFSMGSLGVKGHRRFAKKANTR
jgi:hypothetical protein